MLKHLYTLETCQAQNNSEYLMYTGCNSDHNEFAAVRMDERGSEARAKCTRRDIAHGLDINQCMNFMACCAPIDPVLRKKLDEIINLPGVANAIGYQMTIFLNLLPNWHYLPR